MKYGLWKRIRQAVGFILREISHIVNTLCKSHWNYIRPAFYRGSGLSFQSYHTGPVWGSLRLARDFHHHINVYSGPRTHYTCRVSTLVLLPEQPPRQLFLHHYCQYRSDGTGHCL